MARTSRSKAQTDILLAAQLAAAHRFLSEATWPDGNVRAPRHDRWAADFWAEGHEAAADAGYSSEPDRTLFALGYYTAARAFFEPSPGSGFDSGHLTGRHGAASTFVAEPERLLQTRDAELRKLATAHADEVFAAFKAEHEDNGMGWDWERGREDYRKNYLKGFGTALAAFPQRRR